jgi:hypothetical protein
LSSNNIEIQNVYICHIKPHVMVTKNGISAIWGIYTDQYSDFIIFGTINYSKIIKHNIFTKLKPSVKVEEIC